MRDVFVDHGGKGVRICRIVGARRERIHALDCGRIVVLTHVVPTVHDESKADLGFHERDVPRLLHGERGWIEA